MLPSLSSSVSNLESPGAAKPAVQNSLFEIGKIISYGRVLQGTTAIDP